MSETLSERILDAFAGLDQEGFDWEGCRPLAEEVADLEAKLEAMGRPQRLTLYPGVVGDYDGAYDWIPENEQHLPENAVGYHKGNWPGEDWLVVETLVAQGGQGT